jgi:hypothetical protein
MHDHGHTSDLFLGDIHFESLFQFLMDIFRHAILITAFVMVMMLLVEYLTVQTRGSWSRQIERNRWLQLLFAVIMGVLPGCLGVYVIVVLYAHRLVNFASLVAAMIATSGDEAFVMFAMIPDKALLVMGLTGGIALLSGGVLNLFPFGRRLMSLPENHLKLHSPDEDCTCFEPGLIIPQLKRITFERAVLIVVGLVFTLFLISGDIGPETWNWKRIIFLAISLIELFIVVTVPDHFMSKHLWGHVIKKHFLKIFLWTFGAFLVIHVGLEFLHLDDWVQNNLVTILVIALLVGIIPESGPHMIFLTLFATGNIPLSIFLANSIVQDGHGALPLLAESRGGFIKMKLLNLVIGVLAGGLGLIIGF